MFNNCNYKALKGLQFETEFVILEERKVLPLLEKVALSAQVSIKIKESTMDDCTIILAKTENSLPVNGRFPEAFKFPMLPLSEIRKERLCRQISTWRHIFENNRICFCTNHVKVCHVSKCFKDF